MRFIELPDKLELRDGTVINNLSELIDLLGVKHPGHADLYQLICSQDLETWLKRIGEVEFVEDVETTRLLRLNCEKTLAHLYSLMVERQNKTNQTKSRQPETGNGSHTATSETTASSNYKLNLNQEGKGNVAHNQTSNVCETETQVQISAIPAAGWKFEKWVIGASVLIEASVTVNISEDIQATAYFMPLSSRTMGDLSIGDKVVDLTWNWEFRTGENYTGTGISKPVVWIVAAKDHYGENTGVTLLAEELIGRLAFDNSTNSSIRGSNHWGNSGKNQTARVGLRPWLNSSGKHSNEGFFRAFSDIFKNTLLTTEVSNYDCSKDLFYTTNDIVYIPSAAELGESESTEASLAGKPYPFFAGKPQKVRTALLKEKTNSYWSRSPLLKSPTYVRCVDIHGAFINNSAFNSDYAVRPVVNSVSETLVSEKPDAKGLYRILG